MSEQITVDQSVIANYEDTIKALKAEMMNRIPMMLTFQNTIDTPPVPREALYNQSCGNDGVTVTHWKDTWMDHITKNNAKYKFEENSVMQDYGKYAYHPVIIAGSGPSLKKNAPLLADRGSMGLVSCLHNFAYLTDLGVQTDGYVNLDAGEITIPEMSQGGKHPSDYYWDATKDCTLIAATVSLPELVDRWKGRVLFFAAPVPDMEFMAKNLEVTKFETFFNVGGNALGAAYYHARAVLGGTPIVFVGADFCFDYMRKFHSWQSPYDKQFNGVVPCTDIFGNRVYTWPSYQNFAMWFMHQSLGGNGSNPTMFINCTEGGILGSFPNGNLASIRQMALADCITMYNHHRMMPDLVKSDPAKPKLLF